MQPGKKRLALEEVLRSKTFQRAELLKRFLRYVCEMELAGRRDEISEYSIGIEALGRPSSYSPAGDSSVRSRAHAVREKLAAFYASEGADTPFRIELPKGSYVPCFLPRNEAKPFEELPEVATWRDRSHTKILLRGAAAGATVTALLAILAFRILAPAVPPDPVSAVVREFWGPLLDPGSDVVLCMATAPSMLLHSYADGTIPPGSTPFFPAPKDVSKWYEALHMQDGGGRLYSQTTRNTTLFGDDLAAAAAIKTLTAAGRPVQILPEFGVHRLALRGRNVLLIGSPNYSPFAASILQNAPFSIRYNPAARVEVISGSNAGPDSQVEYRLIRGNASRGSHAYGLITVMPGLDPGDTAHRIVLFSGITGGGTQAAMEFFSSPTALQILKQKMGIRNSGQLPASYQVVVGCELVASLALHPEYETHRILNKAPGLNP